MFQYRGRKDKLRGKRQVGKIRIIPGTPSKVMMNVGPGIGVDAWLNAFDGTTLLSAEYDRICITEYRMEEDTK